MDKHDVHEYARANKVTCIQRAFAGGADLNQIDSAGKTPLQTAIAWGSVDAAYLLLELGADVTIQDNDGSTALHYAIEHKMPKVVEALLRKCPEAIWVSDKHGNQPLWTAVFNAKGNYEIVSLLLRYGSNPQHRNKVNRSPIDMAKRFGDSALLQLLEEKLSEQS